MSEFNAVGASRSFRSRWFCGLLAGALIAGCVSPGPLAFDLDGKPFDPFANPDNAATVLVFIGDDCPISNRYVPELGRLQEDFSKRGVGFWLVHADPSESAAEIREHARSFGLAIPELRDPKHKLADRALAQVTPSAAVFSREGKLVYHGRIDDRVSDLGGREHVQPVRRDLVEAVNAVLAGRTMEVAESKAVGCFIPPAR